MTQGTDPPKSVLTMAKLWADSNHIMLMGDEDGYAPSGHTDPIATCQHWNCTAIREALSVEAYIPIALRYPDRTGSHR